MSNDHFEIRAVQLDLARQMETLDWIFEFIDFASRFGYNTLHLYLEGRIRTESFPYPDPRFSYSLDEMSKVVDYAGSRGMDVIPQVNCFGHAEEFREGITGRFGAQQHVFCPSLPETISFLRSYLKEVASVFPSRYFHIGCDEVWEIGYCSKCRQRLAEGETQDDLFAELICKLHEIVSGELGKTTIMWDDMWEEYPAGLEKIPNDIVQCVWQYDELVDQTKTHFGRRRSDHRMADYKRLGMPILIGPACRNILNTATLTKYARPFAPLGGLMTVWELSDKFLYETYPALAFAGSLWSNLDSETDALMDSVVKELLETEDQSVIQAVHLQQCMRFSGPQGKPEKYLRGPVTPSEYQQKIQNRLLKTALDKAVLDTDQSLAAKVMEDIRTRVDIVAASLDEREIVESVFSFKSGRSATVIPDITSKLDNLLQQVKDLRKRRENQWQRWRSGLEHERGGAIFQDWEESLISFIHDFKENKVNANLLSVRYFLPDYHGAQTVKWYIRYEDSEKWELLVQDVPKPRMNVADEMPYYTVDYPFSQERLPTALRLETYGYGGIGISYLQAWCGNRYCIPDALVEFDGKVIEPEAMLKNDKGWTLIGEEDTVRAYHERELAEAVHTITVDLKAQDLPWQ